MAFSGTPEEIAFKEKLNELLIRNELGGASPYALSFAGTPTSGFSFGVPQFDLSENLDGLRLFADILLNATDDQGNFIIDDGDPDTGRGVVNDNLVLGGVGDITDTKIQDLLLKAQQKGGTSLSSEEKALIDAALASDLGIEEIDASVEPQMDLLISDADRVIGLVAGPDEAFLKSDIGKLFLTDFANQFGITPGGALAGC